ncbi:MAG TPA: ribonuclease HII [Candidatus Paceibacterota bacterium]
MAKRWIIGIDEVGRGPIAGPVTVCAFMATQTFCKKLKGQFDSKKLTPQIRVSISRDLHKMRNEGLILYRIVSVSEKVIDQKGIVYAVNLAISRALKLLRGLNPKLVQILLDGGLHAPEIYKNQRTIVHGDARVPVIGLASVMAKVHRDKLMTNLGTRYPNWGFEKHKGYGTRKHYKALRKHGPSLIHRRSYLH